MGGEKGKHGRDFQRKKTGGIIKKGWERMEKKGSCGEKRWEVGFNGGTGSQQ